MSDDRLIELAKMIVDADKRIASLGRGVKLADNGDKLRAIVREARAILDELEPEPREWRGHKAKVSRIVDNVWCAEVGGSGRCADWVQAFGRTHPEAVRRLNAATRAIDEMEGVKS